MGPAPLRPAIDAIVRILPRGRPAAIGEPAEGSHGLRDHRSAILGLGHVGRDRDGFGPEVTHRQRSRFATIAASIGHHDPARASPGECQREATADALPRAGNRYHHACDEERALVCH
jgi:hypothetical protein